MIRAQIENVEIVLNRHWGVVASRELIVLFSP
jgi:hypothetical protein